MPSILLINATSNSCLTHLESTLFLEIITINATIHNIGDADASDVVVNFFDWSPIKGKTASVFTRSYTTTAVIPLGGSETVSMT